MVSKKRDALILVVVATALFFNVGCGNVSFQPIDVAAKADRSNEETPDPDFPQPPGGGDGDGDSSLPPNPEPVTEQQDFFQNAGGGMLDLLIVVDNSDSMMMDHLNHNIRDMFRGFLDTLDGIDYQIGFIVTDMSYGPGAYNYPGWRGRLDILEGSTQKILTPQTANKQSLFLNTLDREEAIDCRDTVRDAIPGAPCGTNNEEPLKSIIEFVNRKDADNSGFFRDGADFVSLIISDEDELSTGQSNLATTPQQVINHIQSVFGNLKNYTNYSVVIEPGDQQCKQKQACSEILCLGGGNYGDYATALSNMTNGNTASICSSDVSSDLKGIGDRSRSGGLFQEVTLQYDPLPGSVQVIFNPASNINYTVEGRTVKFDSKPSVGTKVTVVYDRL